MIWQIQLDVVGRKRAVAKVAKGRGNLHGQVCARIQQPHAGRGACWGSFAGEGGIVSNNTRPAQVKIVDKGHRDGVVCVRLQVRYAVHIA